jgi:hypothetical protein
MATSAILSTMTDIRLELAETEKVFADKLREHSAALDQQLASLSTEVHEQLPGVAAVQVRQNGELLSRRGRSLPATTGGLDTHRDSITSRFDFRSRWSRSRMPWPRR